MKNVVLILIIVSLVLITGCGNKKCVEWEVEIVDYNESLEHCIVNDTEFNRSYCGILACQKYEKIP